MGRLHMLKGMHVFAVETTENTHYFNVVSIFVFYVYYTFAHFETKVTLKM